MNDQKMASGLRCAWVPVTDAAGRRHMEAHWSCPANVPASVPATAPTPGPTTSPAPRAA